MTDQLPATPQDAWIGMFFCGTCGYEEEGWSSDHLECPYCCDAGGFPQPMHFEPDGHDEADEMEFHGP